MSTVTSRPELLAAIDRERLMEHLRRVTAWTRMPGSHGERAAFDYVGQCLGDLGCRVTHHEMSGYVSVPVGATLHARIDGVQREIDCVTHSMARPTEAPGLHAALVDVGPGTDDDYARAGAAGKVALVRGAPSVDAVARAERSGCFAQIYTEGERLPQHSVSPLAGSPTDETLGALPSSVLLSIRESDAARLREALSRGGLHVHSTADVDAGWRTLPLLTADLAGPGSDATYAFFGCHLDSWFRGVVDNGAGVAAVLEIARVLAERRETLRRGVRFTFWSGHEHGLYSGSNWYADTHWQDLYDHAIMYMSIDSPGASKPTHLARSQVMDELSEIARAAAAEVTGWEVPEPRRPEYGEHPLWRVGVAGMNPHRLTRDDRSWMHTSDDDIDLIDPGVLVKDAQIHLLSLAAVVQPERLPFDYGRLVATLRAALEEIGDCLDVRAAVELTGALGACLRSLPRMPAATANELMRRLGRDLIPTIYTRNGPFEPDPIPRADPGAPRGGAFLIGLKDAPRLRSLTGEGTEARGLRLRLERQLIRLESALRTALRHAREAQRAHP
jgi:hypothetical protein